MTTRLSKKKKKKKKKNRKQTTTEHTEEIPTAVAVCEFPSETYHVVGDEEKLSFLRRSMPEGLCEQFRLSCEQFAVRYWIIDNSGSMWTPDGRRAVEGSRSAVTSTRWDELRDSLAFHANLSARLCAPTEFLLLNARPMSPAIVTTGLGNPDDEIRRLLALARTSPFGKTPLCARIRDVLERVREREHELIATGRRVVLVIASDGEPTDGDVRKALRALHPLPVNIVIRLCTQEDDVVEFWNNVDRDLELDVEVLDDLISEAKEIRAYNKFLAYGLPLHRLREWGCATKILDLLDETRLVPAQIHELAVIIYGAPASALPHPDLGWKPFVKALDAYQRNNPRASVWDPRRKRERFWFDLHDLKTKTDAEACHLM
ncbi:hypothetical protein CTAYLR_006507 [Chrysophaeum taylorii]|uniref:VWFA domain-containing protein n=1 Tax=Chrysophaeum taylorii TaxID=2483200 RepID=A0AAD7XP99_9STRA|nr:hypothetical protein CTAYLR_006507 [Chrysophaeum taylorii]